MRTNFFLIALLCLIQIASAQVSQSWVQTFTSDSTKDETVNDMFVDAQGNVYVTGSQKGPVASQLEAVTVKYNPEGIQQWVQNFKAVASNGAFGRSIYVDASGNVYVTGETAIVSGGSNEALIIKYSPTGTQLWAKRFQYIQNFGCGGYDIITDPDGNVYVTGEYYTGVNFLNNIFLVKYDAGGNIVNQTFYNSGSEGGRKIALDGAGKIIIGGYLNDNDSLSFVVLKYEQNLDLVWSARYGRGIGNQNNIDMVVDNNSNIIISGTNAITIDYSTVKFDPSGSVLWSKQYNSNRGWDKSQALVKDGFGNIYVTGETGTSDLPLTYKITTIKYSPSGDELWVNDYDGFGIGSDGYRGYDIAIDNSNGIYIIGAKYFTLDITTVKYDTDGTFKWVLNYNGPSNGADNPVAIGVDLNGNVYSTGNSLATTSSYDIAIIKYSQTATSVNNEIEIPEIFSLEQNYPNPFNPSTKISWQSTVGSHQTLKVFNVLGKEVATLVDEYKPAGTYAVNFDASGYPSGIYFYRLQADSFVEIKKMILMK